MKHDPKTGPSNPHLADKLFRSVEEDQGFAHISDGLDSFSTVELVEVAKISLLWTSAVVRTLHAFIRKHDKRAELTKKQILLIRKSSASQESLAMKFGVSQGTISNIRRRRTHGSV